MQMWASRNARRTNIADHLIQGNMLPFVNPNLREMPVTGVTNMTVSQLVSYLYHVAISPHPSGKSDSAGTRDGHGCSVRHGRITAFMSARDPQNRMPTQSPS